MHLLTTHACIRDSIVLCLFVVPALCKWESITRSQARKRLPCFYTCRLDRISKFSTIRSGIIVKLYRCTNTDAFRVFYLSPRLLWTLHPCVHSLDRWTLPLLSKYICIYRQYALRECQCMFIRVQGLSKWSVWEMYVFLSSHYHL